MVDAEKQLKELLAEAWEQGYKAAWAFGSGEVEEEIPNPYRRPE
jgi:hypothetical protein